MKLNMLEYSIKKKQLLNMIIGITGASKQEAENIEDIAKTEISDKPCYANYPPDEKEETIGDTIHFTKYISYFVEDVELKPKGYAGVIKITAERSKTQERENAEHNVEIKMNFPESPIILEKILDLNPELTEIAEKKISDLGKKEYIKIK